MKILHLTLKKKWFDMIASGEKKEEYREIKVYWAKRLLKNYDAILFRNGYGEKVPSVLVEYKGLTQGVGDKSWGAPIEKAYILKFGKIIKNDNN